jgi:hypothetical protein
MVFLLSLAGGVDLLQRGCDGNVYLYVCLQ